MKVLKVTRTLIILLVLGMLFTAKGGQVFGQSYAWLHVDGKYIRRSAYCSDPNGIWMGCGIPAFRTAWYSPASALSAFAQWAKDHHFNCLRHYLSYSNMNTTSAQTIMVDIQAILGGFQRPKNILLDQLRLETFNRGVGRDPGQLGHK